MSSFGAILITPFALAATALAQPTVPPSTVATDEAEPIKMMEFLVSSRGESRATNSLTPVELELVTPGVQMEKLLDRIPGINVTTTDPFGFYEFGNNIRVRAFDITKLAVTLDGVPMGNNSPRYGNPIGRFLDTENLETIKVSQGAGDVTTPAYESLGGSLAYFTKDPSKEVGSQLSATVGSFAQKRVFGKFEFGELSPGLTAYISASSFEFEPRGLEGLAKGTSRRFEAKSKYEFAKGSITARYTYNDRDDFDTADISWQDYIDLETKSGKYPLGYTEYSPIENNNASLGAYDYGDFSDKGRVLGPPKYIDPNVGPGAGANAQYYNLWRNGRIDNFYNLIGDFDLTPDFNVKVIPYYQDKKNYGFFGVDKTVSEGQVRAAYKGDPTRTDIWPKMYYNAAGQPIDAAGNVVVEYSTAHAVVAPTATPTNYIPGVPGRTGRDEDFGGHRWGVTTNVEYTIAKNKILGGFWYEHDRHGAVRPTYNLQGGSILGWFEYDQPLFLNYSRFFETDVMQAWLQDTLTLVDGKLDVVFGAKALKLDRSVRGQLDIPTWIANNETYREVSYKDTFLPQLGLLFRLNESTELFANYSENIATPGSDVLSSPSGFQPALLSPERSDNYDIGIRGEKGNFGYTLQGYLINYTDRILSVPIPLSVGSGLAGQNAFQNVGGVDSYGAEFSGDWKTPISGLQLSGAIAYQNSTFQEDLATAVDPTTGNTVFAAIKGKDLGNTPEITANFDARYTWTNFRFNFGGKYFDSVYVNTLNTQQLPSYTTFEAGITYFGKQGTSLDGFSMSLVVNNVFDRYFFTASSFNGTSGSIQADQGRQISLTLSAKF